jgi:thiamine pyrophosphokinase
MHAVVLADGDPPSRAGLDNAWPGWDVGIACAVAADGGVRLAQELGLGVDLWVGDGDSTAVSVLAELEQRGIPMLRAASDKDESDTELALVEAIDRGATQVTVLGGLGGRRLDHALANIALLAHPVLGDRPARLLDDRNRIRLVMASVDGATSVTLPLPGRVGDLVTLLPWGGDVSRVTTSGLRYPLTGERLRAGPARGLSNVRDAPDASVTVQGGRLLVVESPATLGR